ncbi:ESX secretion-associated protein EspG [Haloechinothrix salitolerans]|uniref:ESX secretion-associated protein EspG n=1 Tax=Haloechinothrix salitolerans TaxID=926830 RepID=A0ABW2BTH3_9PSEU
MRLGGPLTPIEFDFLWEAYGTGEVPYPLELRSHGATYAERSELRGQTMRSLVAKGVVDERGALAPWLADYFDLLAKAEISVDSVHVVGADTKAVLAVVCARDEDGLLAVQDEEGLHLSEVPAGSLASSIVGLLPHAERGRERSITMPVDTLVTGAGADFMQRRNGAPATEAGSSDADRKTLARLHAQPRLRGGQIAANSRTGSGKRARSSVLSWFDTESGRYLTKATTGTDGREWITISPADAPTMRQRVGELITWVRRELEVTR